MDVYVARQPIFDRHQQVYAYELLYRKGLVNYSDFSDSDLATSDVVTNALLLIGVDSLTGGKKAFINFSRNLLVSDFTSMFSSETVTIEILEDVEPDKTVIEACEKLKASGYTLVLDDFVYEDRLLPLVQLADIIKIDFLTTPVKNRREVIEKLKPYNVKFLAEKIETPEEYQLAYDMGFDLFQGYFFSKPVIITGRDLPANKYIYLNLIQEVNHPLPDFDKIESIIKSDVSLTYKLLKYINSASYGFKSKIVSIKHALVMLGIAEIKKWISLVALKTVSEDKPDEIMRISIIRARFGELIAERLGLEDLRSDLFLMGLFSMIDTLTDTPMEAVLADLPLPSTVVGAILGEEGRHRDILDTILAYERGDWANFAALADKCNLDHTGIPDFFIEALNWTDQLFTQ